MTRCATDEIDEVPDGWSLAKVLATSTWDGDGDDGKGNEMRRARERASEWAVDARVY